jgi:SAM-dependent methyltransferase
LVTNEFLWGTTLREEDLSFAQTKRRFLYLRLSYRLKALFQKLVGARRLLRFCLNASWLLRRFSFELSCEVFGSQFQEAALALSAEDLSRWIPPQGTVVDIGCGTGRWCRTASRYARQVVGIDYDAGYIEAAQSFSDVPNIEYIAGDVAVELKGRKFDTGLLIHVIEHIPDADTLLHSLHDVVDTLLLEVPDFESDCLNVVRQKLDCPYYSDGDHVREYTASILRDQLDRTGWTICHSKNRGGAILVVATGKHQLAGNSLDSYDIVKC